MGSNALSNQEADCVVEDERCVLHGVTAADADQTAQIRALRSRVIELEAEVHRVRTEVQADVIQLRSQNPRTLKVELAPPGESTPKIPAPLQVAPELAADAASDGSESETGANVDHFADAWNAENATFEERLAARQFFQQNEHDEKSRRWFLGGA